MELLELKREYSKDGSYGRNPHRLPSVFQVVSVLTKIISKGHLMAPKGQKVSQSVQLVTILGPGYGSLAIHQGYCASGTKLSTISTFSAVIKINFGCRHF